MKTFFGNYENHLISIGYQISKIDDYWTLLDNGEALMQNRRRGELLDEAYKMFGE